MGVLRSYDQFSNMVRESAFSDGPRRRQAAALFALGYDAAGGLKLHPLMTPHSRFWKIHGNDILLVECMGISH